MKNLSKAARKFADRAKLRAANRQSKLQAARRESLNSSGIYLDYEDGQHLVRTRSGTVTSGIPLTNAGLKTGDRVLLNRGKVNYIKAMPR